jgi:catechol 2,3-dioxygenase-like lactoylglutathione lyase family enzyme
MTGIPASHVGFIVKDIDVAIKRFSEILGVTFNPPKTVTLDHLYNPDEERTGTITVAYSVEGPPHYELIQGEDHGIYSMHGGGEGMHHVGVWEHDIETRMAELAEKGMRLEARVLLDDGSLLTAFNNPEDLHGVIIEFIDDADRPIMEKFMKTGSFDDGFDKFSFPDDGQMRL